MTNLRQNIISDCDNGNGSLTGHGSFLLHALDNGQNFGIDCHDCPGSGLVWQCDVCQANGGGDGWEEDTTWNIYA